MGWVNSTVFFNRAMKRLTSEPSLMRSTRTYIDDVLQRGRSFRGLLKELIRLLLRCERWNLRIHPKKTELFQTLVETVGFTVDQNGIKIAKEKIADILEYPEPTSKREVRRFLGKVEFVSKLLPGYGKVAAYLSDASGKKSANQWED